MKTQELGAQSEGGKAHRVFWADMAIDAIQLTKQLVDIESSTYHEAPAGEFLAEFLAAQGYLIERQPVPQPDATRNPSAGTGPRFNVYASLPGVTPDVVLSTHMDTVPPFLGPCREDAENLYGRGTCDAKGIIAAQIAAAEKLIALRKEWLCCLWWVKRETRRGL